MYADVSLQHFSVNYLLGGSLIIHLGYLNYWNFL